MIAKEENNVLKPDRVEFYNKESQKAENIIMAIVIRASCSRNKISLNVIENKH